MNTIYRIHRSGIVWGCQLCVKAKCKVERSSQWQRPDLQPPTSTRMTEDTNSKVDCEKTDGVVADFHFPNFGQLARRGVDSKRGHQSGPTRLGPTRSVQHSAGRIEVESLRISRAKLNTS
jgi:hypothetical protein